MPDPVNISQILSQVEQFIGSLTQLNQELPEPQDRAAVDAILQQLRENKAKADILAPQYANAMQASLSDMQTNLSRLTSDLQQEQARLQSLKVEPLRSPFAEPTAPPKPSEPPPVDLGLGEQLRKDLLEHLFGKPEEPTQPRQPGRDIWQDWK